MPLVRKPLNMDEIIRRYIAGDSCQVLAEAFGVHGDTIRARLAEAGVPRRKNTESPRRERVSIDSDAVVKRYLAGESEKALAAAFGVDRNAIRTRLRKAGVEPRNRSEAAYLRMAHATADERARLASAAHDAARGRRRPLSEKLARAATMEAMGVSAPSVSAAEKLLAGWLSDAGLAVIHQKAVGPYNVDLAAGTVAVEVLGGGWHRAKLHGERLRYLLDAGWDVIYIWVDGRRSPLTAEAAQYVVSHCQVRDGDPAAPRCYRVIRGGGEFIAEGSADGDDIPDVLPITDRPDVPPAEVGPGYCHCGCDRQTSGGRAHDGGRVRYISGHNPQRRNRNPG
jgi:hypothetical protein